MLPRARWQRRRGARDIVDRLGSSGLEQAAPLDHAGLAFYQAGEDTDREHGCGGGAFIVPAFFAVATVEQHLPIAQRKLAHGDSLEDVLTIFERKIRLLTG